MAKTVIGIFDNASEAQQAVSKLTDKGFSRDRIDVSNAGSSSATTGTSYTDREEEGSGIGNFFKNLFSDDDEETNKYTHVARQSQSIVTVHAMSSDEAEDAADILDDCGAVDVDERAASSGYAGTTRTSGITAGNTNLVLPAVIPLVLVVPA